jgi:phosphoglycolate phosphatase-like HAD superfamily hydrolase
MTTISSSRGPKDRGIPRFARDDKGFARDDKGFARDDKGFARDDRGGARDDKGGARDDKGFALDDRDGGRLVLFDVDGTLLSAGRAARESILAALTSVLGWNGSGEGNDFSGKTDPQILRELVLDAVGRDHFESMIAVVLDRYVEELARRLRPEAVVAKPGIPALLERLAGETQVTLGLLTGNIERGARMKLEPPGFNRYFPFGAFGDDSADRYCLPAIAVARAREHKGREFSGRSVVIVGDSVHDVACGRSLGVRAIAVATGPTPFEKLAAERPDALFRDFRDVDAVAEVILR